MATDAQPKVSRGIAGLRCPHCGEVGTLVIRVEDAAVECAECDESLGVEMIRDTTNAWDDLLHVLEAFPERKDGE